MYLRGKHFSQIDKDDIAILVENQVPEGKSLDYKRDFELSTREKKRELLFDITSFANTEGGCLIYGIEEDTNNSSSGIPGNLIGVSTNNIDGLFLQVHSLVNDGTSPVPNIELKEIKMEGASIIVIGIPKSRGIPHMVTLGKTNKFYKRNSSGKYLMDVYELNRSFLSGQELKSRLKDFIGKRINLIDNGDLGIKKETGAYVLVHMIPLGNLGKLTFDFSQTEITNKVNKNLTPFASGGIGFNYTYNIDGLFQYVDRKRISNYCQIFHDGRMEHLAANMSLVDNLNPGRVGVKVVAGDHFELQIALTIKKTIGLYKRFEIEPPYLMLCCLRRHKGYKIGSLNLTTRYSPNSFGRDTVYLPEVIIDSDSLSDSFKKSLQFFYNTFWQAGGYSMSPYTTLENWQQIG